MAPRPGGSIPRRGFFVNELAHKPERFPETRTTVTGKIHTAEFGYMGGQEVYGHNRNTFGLHLIVQHPEGWTTYTLHRGHGTVQRVLDRFGVEKVHELTGKDVNIHMRKIPGAQADIIGISAPKRVVAK